MTEVTVVFNNSRSVEDCSWWMKGFKELEYALVTSPKYLYNRQLAADIRQQDTCRIPPIFT
jgi:hypothetical protein